MQQVIGEIPDAPPPSVLVVEDEFTVRRELCELLTEEGYKVVAASNGREALNAIDDGLAPSVVLLDLMMPVMDGWQFLEHLEARHAELNVVLATANEGEPLPRGLPRLRKPYGVQPLLDIIAEHSA